MSRTASTDLGFCDDHTLYSEGLVAFFSFLRLDSLWLWSRQFAVHETSLQGIWFKISCKRCLVWSIIRLSEESPEMPILITGRPNINSVNCLLEGNLLVLRKEYSLLIILISRRTVLLATLQRLNHSCRHFAALKLNKSLAALTSEVSTAWELLCVSTCSRALKSPPFIFHQTQHSPTVNLCRREWQLRKNRNIKKSPTMLWIRKRSIRHMITWCGISGLESSKLLLQLLRCDTGSPTALCRGVWLFLRELPDTVVSALWETSAVAPSGTANISRKCSLHAALSQQTLHLIPRVSSRDGYMSWHQRKGVRATKAGMMGDKVDYRWGNAIAPE